MSSQERRKKWVHVLKAIVPGIYDVVLPICPACEQKRVDYLYVGEIHRAHEHSLHAVYRIG